MTNGISPTCGSPEHSLHRRAFLGGVGGLLGGMASLDALGGPLPAGEVERRRKRVILELMPRMAARIHQSAVILSFTSPNTGHTGASVFALMSGDRRDTGNIHPPSLGCLLGRELSQPGSRLYKALGVGPETEVYDQTGRPMFPVQGKPVPAAF